MSISVDEIITLAFNLWRDGFLVARGAPVEFRLLVDGLLALHGMMHIFATEEPVLMCAGEDRQRMLTKVLVDVKETLQRLEETFNKLWETNCSGLERTWDNSKWAMNAKDIDALRSKLSYNNGIFSLLLTSITHCSVKYLEEVTDSLSERVTELKEFLKHACTGNLQRTGSRDPTACTAQSLAGRLSRTATEVFGSESYETAGIKFLEECLKAAEVRKRWMTVGIQEWIYAAHWWFLRAKLGLRLIKTAADKFNPELFGELLKASWILTNIVLNHPELSRVDLDVWNQTSKLIKAINTEFYHLQTLQIKLPEIKTISSFNIWEGYVESNGVQVDQILQAQAKAQTAWESSNDVVIFHSYASFKLEGHHSMLPVMVKVLIDTESMDIRLIIHDQGWRCILETSLLGKNSRKFAHLDRNTVLIFGASIIFTTLETARHLCSILRFYTEFGNIIYANQSEMFFKEIHTHYAFIILMNMRLPNEEFFENLKYILSLGDHSSENSSITIYNHQELSQTKALAFLDSVRKRAENAKYSYENNTGNQSQTWLEWILSRDYIDVAKNLLRGRGMPDDVAEYLLRGCETPEVSPSSRQLSSAWKADDAGIHAIVNQYMLFTAVQNRDSTIVRSLLETEPKVDLTQFDHNNYPVLYHKTSQEIVKLLIEHGADWEGKITPSAQSPNSQIWVGAPLNHHVRNSNLEMVKYLLKAGADVNKHGANDKKLTPLHYAALNRHSDEEVVKGIISCLLEDRHRAEINSKCSLGNTPLHYAARGPYQSILELLLEGGADMESENRDYYTPIYDAAALANNAMVKILLDRGSKVDEYNQNSTKGPTSILWAVVNHAGLYLVKSVDSILETLELLINKGAKIEAQAGRELETALHRAAELGFSNIAKFLLDKKAPIDATDKKGRTPLHLAVRNAPNTNTTTLLLQHGALPNAVDSKLRTPLHYIHQREELSPFVCREMARRLIQYGAKVNEADHLGRTALHYPINYDIDSGGVYKLLLAPERGANVDVQDYNLQTPLSFLLTRPQCHLEYVKQLHRRGANLKKVDRLLRTPLHFAKDVRIVEYLLENGAELEASDWEGCTPLHVAARNGEVGKVRALLNKGADIGARDYHRRTSFHYAVLQYHPYDASLETSRLLQKRGADIDCQDDQLCTPLHYAIIKGTLRNALSLIHLHANAEIRESRGYTALHCVIDGAISFSPVQKSDPDIFVHTLDDILDVVEAMIEKGIDISIRDNNGRTALDMLNNWGCQAAEEEGIKTKLQEMLTRNNLGKLE